MSDRIVLKSWFEFQFAHATVLLIKLNDPICRFAQFTLSVILYLFSRDDADTVHRVEPEHRNSCVKSTVCVWLRHTMSTSHIGQVSLAHLLMMS